MLLPTHTFSIEVPAPVNEVVDSMRNAVEPVRLIRWWRDHTRFQGTVDESGFRMSRILNYQNSFVPVLRGAFEPAGSRTVIRVRMSIHSFVQLFLWVWLSFPAWIVFLVARGPAQQDIRVVVTLCLVMIGFGLALAWGAFWFEVPRSKKLFEQVFLNAESNSIPLDQQQDRRSR